MPAGKLSRLAGVPGPAPHVAGPAQQGLAHGERAGGGHWHVAQRLGEARQLCHLLEGGAGQEPAEKVPLAGRQVSARLLLQLRQFHGAASGHLQGPQGCYGVPPLMAQLGGVCQPPKHATPGCGDPPQRSCTPSWKVKLRLAGTTVPSPPHAASARAAATGQCSVKACFVPAGGCARHVRMKGRRRRA